MYGAEEGVAGFAESVMEGSSFCRSQPLGNIRNSKELRHLPQQLVSNLLKTQLDRFSAKCCLWGLGKLEHVLFDRAAASVSQVVL